MKAGTHAAAMMQANSPAYSLRSCFVIFAIVLPTMSPLQWPACSQPGSRAWCPVLLRQLSQLLELVKVPASALLRESDHVAPQLDYTSQVALGPGLDFRVLDLVNRRPPVLWLQAALDLQALVQAWVLADAHSFARISSSAARACGSFMVAISVATIASRSPGGSDALMMDSTSDFA